MRKFACFVHINKDVHNDVELLSENISLFMHLFECVIGMGESGIRWSYSSVPVLAEEMS